MGLHKKELIYYENKHNNKFPNDKIKIINRENYYLYCHTEFGICKIHIGNVGKSIPTIQTAINKTQYLINRLIKYHGFKYDYSLVKYTKTSEKIILICKDHGNFEKSVNSLICNKNIYCPICYNNNIRSLNKTSTTEKFIKKALLIHGKVYDYSKVVYKTAKNKIKIICKKHGEFEQTPDNHLSGYGCVNCSIELNSWNYTTWEKKAEKSKNFDSFKVYIIKCWNDKEEFYKIGKTYRNINKRLNKHTLPYNFKIIKIIKGNSKEISELENKLKQININNKYKPQLTFGGQFECYKLIKL